MRSSSANRRRPTRRRSCENRHESSSSLSVPPHTSYVISQTCPPAERKRLLKRRGMTPALESKPLSRALTQLMISSPEGGAASSLRIYFPEAADLLAAATTTDTFDTLLRACSTRGETSRQLEAESLREVQRSTLLWRRMPTHSLESAQAQIPLQMYAGPSHAKYCRVVKRI